MNARAEARRRRKLQMVQDQINNGSLVIRKMTEEERRLYPPTAIPRRGRPQPPLEPAA